MQVVKALEQILARYLLFEGHYEDLAESLDELAERIRSLNAKVPALSDLIKLASIDEANPNATANEMLKSLTKDQDIIRDTLYKGLKVAQAEGDEGTADMIIGRIKVHEKNRWMLNSSIL